MFSKISSILFNYFFLINFKMGQATNFDKKNSFKVNFSRQLNIQNKTIINWEINSQQSNVIKRGFL